jgi:hypothetical protein
MEKEEKLFPKADYDKEIFTVKIIMVKGGTKFMVETHEGEEEPSYHEVIGAIETVKHSLIVAQAKKNTEVKTE